MGDFNAHHEAWDSTLADSRGEALSDSIDLSPLIILNEPTIPTHLPSNGNPSSPDASLASAHVDLASTWVTHVQLNSDHLPVIISLPADQDMPPRATKSYTNFRKADWAVFIRECEAEFRSLPMPSSVGAGEKVFRDVLLKAAKHAIPAGYCRNYTPGMSKEAFVLLKERLSTSG